MDVLVKWEDNTLNVVESDKLVPVIAGQNFCKGVMVKMLVGGIWYNGQVIDTEATSTSESENEPLSKYRIVSISSDDEPLSKYMAVRNQTHTPVDQDSNKRDSYVEQACEVISYQAEVLSSCFCCSTLLCIDHFQSEEISCISHKNRANEDNIVPVTSLNVDRCPREKPRPSVQNQSKLAKTLRNQGKEYYSIRSKKIVPAWKLLGGCESETCVKTGKQCNALSEENRADIFATFYALSDLQLRREFIGRHCELVEVKQRTTNTASRKAKVFGTSYP
ncbi:unnamed protein product [Acanthoscelides obtectus]|uniref:Uncharacterized protein n=1 Tax=Acanthoscelides obtectus TaxID=200917 RepID=A0A9P0LCI9_ACAOB|nr:unnamed protein product [Acanthoscelides obtectus]CAK1666325.1 hypothetical protein AOBTE_LOCUS25257 [Acanthoscelides obtectus]